MIYEKSLLASGEEILGTYRPHALPYVGPYWFLLGGAGACAGVALLGGGVPLLGLSLVLCLAWAARFLDWRNNIMIVTNMRVIKGSGILSKTTRDSALEKITDLGLSQSVIGRILDYGTLRVMTANDNGEDVFPGICSPKKAKSLILETKLKNELTREHVPGDGDIAAIERLNSRGVLSDMETRELLDKISKGRMGGPKV